MKRYSKLRTTLVVAVAAGALAGCGGKEERLQAHLEKSRALMEQGNFDVAGVEVRNAMQIDPRNSEAMFVAGLITERGGTDLRRAFLHFVKAVELDPSNVAARARVGRYRLLGGDLKAAEEALSEIEKIDPKALDGRNLRASILAARGDLDGAIREATAILNEDPSQSETASFLAGLYAAKKSDKEALAVLEAAIAASPKATSLRVVRAALAVRAGDLALAEQEYRRIIEIEPRRTEHRNNLAAFLSRQKRLDEAEKVLRESIAADTKDVRRRLALLEFMVTLRSLEAAENEARAQIREDSRAYELQFQLARFARAGNKLDEASKVYRDIIGRDQLGPHGLRARIELSGILIGQNRRPEAERLVDEVLKQNPRENQALLLRAQFAADRNEMLSAIGDLRAVLRDQPDSPAIIGALARAHLINKEPDLARETIQRAVDMFPNRTALRFILADFLAANGDPVAALRQVDEVLKTDPRSLEALDLRARIQLSQKNLAGAEETFKRLTTVAPDQPAAFIRLGQYYVTLKRFEPALAQFEQAAKLAPRSPEPVLLVINTLLAQGNAAAAAKRAEAALAGQPLSVPLLVALGELRMQTRQFTEAEKLFRDAIGVEPRVPVAYLNLARLSVAQGQRPAASQWLRQGVGAMPENDGLRLALAELYLGGNEWDNAIKVYEEALKRNPENQIAANNLAALIAEHRLDEANLKRALALAQRFEKSDNAAFLDTLGRVQFRLGMLDQSIATLRRAVERDADVPLYHYHLGMALLKRGDDKAAREHLRRAVESKATFPGIDEAKKILGQG